MANTHRILQSASLLSLMIAAQANAQQAASGTEAESQPQEAAKLEQVVITATRTETKLQTTPIAVSAFSADAIRQRGIGNLADVAAYVPGLSIGSGQGLGAGTANISIRGMGVDSGDSDGSVGTYVDEVFFSSGRGNILGLMDTARVEVLRGPQGTLFGRNTIAGAIQYVTNAPKREFGGYVTGTVGSFDRVDVEAALNLPVSSDLALRLAGRYADRDGHVRDQFAGINRGSERTQAGRLRALWTPTDQLTVNLKLEQVDFNNNGRAALVPVGGVYPDGFFASTSGITITNPRAYESTNFSPGSYSTPGFDGPDYFKFKQTIAQATVEYDLNSTTTLKSITSMSRFRHELASDIDQSPLNILYIVDPNFRTKALTQELQLNGKLSDSKLRYTAGLYYYNRENSQAPGRIQSSPTFVNVFRTPTQSISASGNPINKNEAIAGYGQLGYDITPSLTANLGVRYSRETVKGRLLAVPGSTEQRNTFSNVSPQVGLDFKASNDVFLYGKAAKGFRAGGFTLDPALTGGSLPFTPETAWTYEGGMRLTALNGRLRINPTIYQTDWKNIQFLDNGFFNNSLIVVTRNAGDARIRGAELETQFAVTDKFLMRGAFAYIDGKYTRVENSLQTGQPIVPLTEPLARAPRTKYSVGARYTLPLSLAGAVTVNADYNWVDDQKSTVRRNNTVIMPAVGLLNARLQYVSADNRYTIAVFGTNLTNRYYLVGGTRFGAERTVLADSVDVGRPREIGAELRFSF